MGSSIARNDHQVFRFSPLISRHNLDRRSSKVLFLSSHSHTTNTRHPAFRTPLCSPYFFQRFAPVLISGSPDLTAAAASVNIRAKTKSNHSQKQQPCFLEECYPVFPDIDRHFSCSKNRVKTNTSVLFPPALYSCRRSKAYSALDLQSFMCLPLKDPVKLCLPPRCNTRTLPAVVYRGSSGFCRPGLTRTLPAVLYRDPATFAVRALRVLPAVLYRRSNNFRRPGLW